MSARACWAQATHRRGTDGYGSRAGPSLPLATKRQRQITHPV